MTKGSQEIDELSELHLRILDCLLNTPPVYSEENVFETVQSITEEKKDLLRNEWNLLLENDIVTVKDLSFVINPVHREEVMKRLRSFLDEKGITPDNVFSLMEKMIEENKSKLASFIRMMGKVSGTEQNRSVSISDYDWDSELISFCDQLVKANLLLKRSTRTRKHYYLDYYFRECPFRSESLIENLILKYLNIEGLQDLEWKIISLLLLSDRLTLKYDTLKDNIDFTDPQLRELLTKLKERGLVEEKAREISLQAGLKEPFIQYFEANIYPKVRSASTNRLKKAISTSLSNLWLFSSVKRINELPIGENRSGPLRHKVIKKSDLKEYESQFADMNRLGLVVDLEDQLLIPQDPIKDVGNWLKSSIKKTVTFIPARDYYLARETLRKIFSICEDYVKIQDPYLGEETFFILEYIPSDLRIMLLTGIRVGTGEDPERIGRQIERFNSERRGKFHITFVGNVNGDAPFHDRLIISKNNCWQSGTSLKEIGRGKDTTVVDIPKTEKEEKIEQAFDRWWEAKANVLKKKMLRRLNFKEWRDVHI